MEEIQKSSITKREELLAMRDKYYFDGLISPLQVIRIGISLLDKEGTPKLETEERIKDAIDEMDNLYRPDSFDRFLDKLKNTDTPDYDFFSKVRPLVFALKEEIRKVLIPQENIGILLEKKEGSAAVKKCNEIIDEITKESYKI